MNPFFTIPTIADKNKSVACMGWQLSLETKTARTSFCRADPSLTINRLVRRRSDGC
jgi:hypothetical protein